MDWWQTGNLSLSDACLSSRCVHHSPRSEIRLWLTLGDTGGIPTFILRAVDSYDLCSVPHERDCREGGPKSSILLGLSRSGNRDREKTPGFPRASLTDSQAAAPSTHFPPSLAHVCSHWKCARLLNWDTAFCLHHYLVFLATRIPSFGSLGPCWAELTKSCNFFNLGGG